MRHRFLYALTTEVAKVLIILVILLSLAYLRDVHVLTSIPRGCSENHGASP